MSSKIVRTFMLFLGIIILLCLVWDFVLEDKMGRNYIYVWFLDTLVVYIPLAISTVGILVWVASFLFEDKLKKRVRTASFTVIGVAVLFFFSAFITIQTSTYSDENKQKYVAAEQKFQVQNFVPTPELKEDLFYSRPNKLNHIALGSHFAYHVEKDYKSKEDDLLSLEISAYSFEKISKLSSRRICRLLTDEFFRWKVRIGSYDGDSVSGEANGKEYTYYVTVKEDEYRDFSYFAILVKDDDSVSLLMLRAYYKQDYSIDIEDIIEKMCAD